MHVAHFGRWGKIGVKWGIVVMNHNQMKEFDFSFPNNYREFLVDTPWSFLFQHLKPVNKNHPDNDTEEMKTNHIFMNII